MRRMAKSEIQIIRLRKWIAQDKKCLLCGTEIEKENTVLDHDHETGECRGVLHRGCNAYLGAIENRRAINGLQDNDRFETLLLSLHSYIKESKMGILHPTHKSEDEKRLLKNKRAVKRRRVNKAKGTSLAGRVSYSGAKNEAEDNES